MQIQNKKGWLTLLIIPIELLIGNFVIYPTISKYTVLSTIVTVLIFMLGFLIAMFLNREFLKEQWLNFKKKFWLKFILSIGLVVVAQMILTFSRSLIGLNKGENSESLSLWISLLPSLWAMIPTLLAPFVEELVFRHYLFMRFKNGNRIIFWGLWLVQSVLFGLVHWSNFNGNIIQMVPYMVIGAFFGLIYYFSKNIWQNILTHFMFNSIATISLIGSLIMLMLSGSN